MNWTDCIAVEQHPNKLSGVPIFKNTRIPVSSLFTNLRDGATIDDFIDWFPGVTREQVESVLTYAADQLEPQAA